MAIADIRVTIHCSTWRLRLGLWFAKALLWAFPSESLAKRLVRWFVRNGIRLVRTRIVTSKAGVRCMTCGIELGPEREFRVRISPRQPGTGPPGGCVVIDADTGQDISNIVPLGMSFTAARAGEMIPNWRVFTSDPAHMRNLEEPCYQLARFLVVETTIK